jgi:hypothetical protein
MWRHISKTNIKTAEDAKIWFLKVERLKNLGFISTFGLGPFDLAY